MTVEHVVLECLLEWLQEQRWDVMRQIASFEPSLRWVEEERTRLNDMKTSDNQNDRDHAYTQERSVEQFHWKVCSERFELEQLKCYSEECLDFLFGVKYFQ